MLTVMDMSTGKIEPVAESEFGVFEDEVLNAEWLPPQVAPELGLQEVHHAQAVEPDFDADAYLASVYRNQA
ncbi:MAG: hypothetical protein EG825_17055 [Rhodocyclaceae bacterium]|nr:hypothetical protein [Rhodocyclaceae bacterium]